MFREAERVLLLPRGGRGCSDDCPSACTTVDRSVSRPIPPQLQDLRVWFLAGNTVHIAHVSGSFVKVAAPLRRGRGRARFVCYYPSGRST